MSVQFEKRDGYAIVTIDNPPVNAIGRAERQGLMDACVKIAAATDIRAVILTGKGRNFAAGADVREHDNPALAPHFPDVVNEIEASVVPWIAAIRGAALGGACEIALGCRKRLGSPSITIGLPEVTLGIVPGAGGTQRLPRLVGFAAAVAMISEGRAVKMGEALQLNLVDEIVDDPVARAIAIAAKPEFLTTEKLSARPRPELDIVALDAARDRVGKRARGQTAPLCAIDLVAMSTQCDFVEGSAKERETFLVLRESSQARALRHIFLAERAARAPAKLAATAPIAAMRTVVVGGGTMGAGIAYALAQNGLRVRIIETDQASKARAEANVGKILADAVRRGLLDERHAADQAERLTVQIGYDGLDDADLAIEAAFEDMAVKREIFAKLNAAMPAHAVLATNTSYLDINDIAAASGRPESVVGLHFFSPPHIMKLLEIVRADRTSDAALTSAFNVASKLRKIPVLSGVCDGFIGNRILSRYREIADMILMDGGLPWEIDEAMVEFGYPMGPYEAQDLSGLDIAFANRKQKAPTRDPRRRYIPIADRMVAEGRLGRKAGVGWYRYPGGGAVVDPLIEDMIVEESRFAKVTRRRFSGEEVRRRLLAAMINGAAEILEESIAAHPRDIDLVTVYGYGFPRWRGGLMHFAREYGFRNVIADIESFAKEDPVVWRVSERLRFLAESESFPGGMENGRFPGEA